jgi:peroxiredoxin Q/BCP
MLTVPETGSKAPLFKAEDQNGEMVSLEDFKGKKVALYFYPKDNTPTCTTQACNFRDNYTLLQQRGIVVLGVSVDNIKSHKKFEQKFSLPFTLISDPEHEIATKYGVWGLKKFMGREFMGVHRTTFLINEKGVIEHIVTKVKSKEHTAQILELWK